MGYPTWRSPLLAVAVCAVASASAAAVSAAPVTGTRFAVFLGNEVQPNNTFLAEDQSITDPSSVDAQYSRDFTGTTFVFCEDTCTEEQGTMTLSASGQASAVNGVLKASVSTTIENPLFLSGDGYENDPFVVDTDFNVDENGIPEQINAHALAAFEDMVAVSGGNDLESIQLQFQLTGEIATDLSFFTFAQVGQGLRGPLALSADETLATAAGDGSFDMTVISNPIPVVDGFAELSFGLYTRVTYLIDDLFGEGEGPFTSTADFFNTLTIQNIVGLDGNGQQVALNTVTGSDGTVFLAAGSDDVREPATAILLGLGLAGVGVATRRRRS